MPRAPRGLGSSRRPRAGARAPRESLRSRSTEAPPRTLAARRRRPKAQSSAFEEYAGPEKTAVVEPPADAKQSATPAILAKVQLDDIGDHAQRVFEAWIAPRKEMETGASFIITKAQKAELHHRGYTEEQIREMKPEEAHRALGLIS
jgi:hypothetical protein